jgi:hypothetical protein
LSLTDTQHPLIKLFGHRGGAITGLSFSPNAKLLASADASGTVILWDLHKGEPLISELKSGGISATGLAFRPYGRASTVGSDDRIVTLWPFGIEAWRKRARVIANRDPTPEEGRLFIPEQPPRPICGDSLADNR